MKTLPHVDRNNLSSEPNLVVLLTRFRQGGIWVETAGGSVKILHKGQARFGELLDVASHPVLFDPRRLHCTMGWRGTRIVLIGFTVRSTEKLSASQRAEASDLGFVLPPAESMLCELRYVRCYLQPNFANLRNLFESILSISALAPLELSMLSLPLALSWAICLLLCLPRS